MRVPSQPQAIRQISERFAGPVDPDCRALRLKKSLQVDAVLRAGRFVFVVEWKSVGSAASTYSIIRDVRQHTEEIKRAGEADGEVVPLVAVPFMGKFGRERCAEYNVSWLDLSGNAQISAPGLRILVEGKPNQYKRTGRPSTPFAPRSSRIARWLLMHPIKPLTQRELARATGTDEGYTSRVVGKLEDEGLANDEGVFHGASTRNGIHCVHPVQTYLDLHAHPERAGDVARELRSEHLHWRTGD